MTLRLIIQKPNIKRRKSHINVNSAFPVCWLHRRRSSRSPPNGGNPHRIFCVWRQISHLHILKSCFHISRGISPFHTPFLVPSLLIRCLPVSLLATKQNKSKKALPKVEGIQTSIFFFKSFPGFLRFYQVSNG